MAAATASQLEGAIDYPWARVEGLPCTLTVEIVVPDFKVSDLVELVPGRIIATRWTVGLDVPLLINGELVGNFDRFAAATYKPTSEGLARVTVVDADGRSDTSEIRFKKLR